MLITSRKNPLIQWALSLHDKKVRDSEKLFFTEGKKLYDEGIGSGFLPEKVFVLENHHNIEGKEIYEVTREVYDKISDEKAPEGIFAVWKKPEFKEKKKSSIVLLEELQDPGNMGTVMRTAVAFGVSEIVSVRGADPFSPKSVRSTMGAIFKIGVVPFDDIEEAVEYAKAKTTNVIATTLHPDSISVYEADSAYATIMIGNEGRGLSDRAIALADSKVIIPIENTESLNASVAASIFMYDSMTKRNKK